MTDKKLYAYVEKFTVESQNLISIFECIEVDKNYYYYHLY